MKNKIKAIAEHLKIAIHHNPVEVILTVLFCIIGCASYDLADKDWIILLSYFPALFLVSYTLNILTREKRWRFVYYASFFFFIFFWWKTKEDLVTWVIAVLFFLIGDWKTENKAFVKKGLHFLRAFFSAFLLAGVAYLLSIAIYYSIQYIFELGYGSESRFMTYATSIAFAGVLPLLFLTFHQEREEEGYNKLFDVLMNYVLSPALLIYTAILYLYFIKIAVLWSLPKGAVAIMVMAFVSATFVFKACQPFLLRRYYDWFYRFSSLAVLPALIMFWVGTSYRINQYGYTEDRVYLVIVGVVLTVTALLFIFRRTGKYLYSALLAFVLLITFTYIPGITVKDIERRSQEGRENTGGDTSGYNYSSVFIENMNPVDIASYKTMQKVYSYKRDTSMMWTLVERDTLFLYDKNEHLIFREHIPTLFKRQMEKVGLTPFDSIKKADYPALLRIELDSALLLLDEISVERFYPDSAYTVNAIYPGFYLQK